MLNDPRVSACIVLYKSGSEVLNTVKCIQACETPIILYLADNSPKDDTARIIQAMCPGAIVLKQPYNVGFGRANNAVLNQLRTHYHLLVNPDITFEPDLVARMVAYMDTHKDVAILAPRVLNPDGTEQLLPKRQPTVRYLLGGKLGRFGKIFRRWRDEYTRADETFTEPTEIDFASGCFLMIRSQIFYKLKGFDPRFFLYLEDTDLSRRVKQQQFGKIIFHPDMQVTHAWKRESFHSTRALMMHLKSAFKYFTKWGWRW